MISKHLIQRNLIIAIDFISSKYTDKERVIHSKINNIETMISDKVDEVIQELFQVLLSSYQIGLETSIKGSDFIFGCVYLLYYKCHKKFKMRWIIYRFVK